jgi:NAD(P)-dependent dehydrogenase (short-subunit alcohol dehydrogenase family)
VGSAQPWYIGSPAPNGTFWRACAVSRTPILCARPIRCGSRRSPLDITKPDDIAALERLLPSRLDAVVNNAGVVVAGPVEAEPAPTALST